MLITSCRLVCINAGVSIPERPSGFPRYVVASRRIASRRRRALRASERTGDCCSGPREPCCNVPRSAPQSPSAEGCSTPGGFNCRYKPRRWISSIIPESEITSRAKLVTDLVLYLRERCRCHPSRD